MLEEEEEEEDAPAAPSFFLFASLLSTTQAPYPVFFVVVVVVSVVIIQIDRYCLFFVMSRDRDWWLFLFQKKDTFCTGSSLIPSIASTKNTWIIYHARHKCDHVAMRECVNPIFSHILILFTVIGIIQQVVTYNMRLNKRKEKVAV